jgi:hypothetical protein
MNIHASTRALAGVMQTIPRQLAAEIKGFDWLRNYRVVPSRTRENDAKELKSDSENIKLSINAKKQFFGFLSRKPEWVVVLFGQLFQVIAVLFPPFNAHLSDGMIANIGFAFIFSPPGAGNFRATVDAPLLAVIVMSIFFSTLACYFLFREIRHSSSFA